MSVSEVAAIVIVMWTLVGGGVFYLWDPTDVSRRTVFNIFLCGPIVWLCCIVVIFCIAVIFCVVTILELWKSKGRK